MNMLENITLYSLFEQPEFCLNFILSKNKDFQSGALLKMPPSSPSMGKICQDIKN